MPRARACRRSCLSFASGVDLRRCRQATVERRVRSRMLLVHAGDCGEYLDCLLREPRQVDHLIERVTIKVSRFFRHAAIFDLLAHRVLPELAGRHPGRPLQVWSAGCGCGEEVYSLAILLEELDSPPAHPESRVTTTDIDESALAVPRALLRGPDEGIAPQARSLRPRSVPLMRV